MSSVPPWRHLIRCKLLKRGSLLIFQWELLLESDTKIVNAVNTDWYIALAYFYCNCNCLTVSIFHLIGNSMLVLCKLCNPNRNLLLLSMCRNRLHVACYPVNLSIIYTLIVSTPPGLFLHANRHQ